MKSVLMAVFAALGLIVAGQPDAFADSRRATNQSTRPPLYSNAQANPDSGKFERKCMILPCGTRWCYNVRR